MPFFCCLLNVIIYQILETKLLLSHLGLLCHFQHRSGTKTCVFLLKYPKNVLVLFVSSFSLIWFRLSSSLAQVMWCTPNQFLRPQSLSRPHLTVLLPFSVSHHLFHFSVSAPFYGLNNKVFDFFIAQVPPALPALSPQPLFHPFLPTHPLLWLL